MTIYERAIQPVVVGSIVLMLPTFASADRIYRLNNYPEWQEGGTLSGFIQVTDDAHDDFKLSNSEIVAWSWKATNNGITLSADSSDPAALMRIVSRAPGIDEFAIWLVSPTAVDAHSSNIMLGTEDPELCGATGDFAVILKWRKAYPLPILSNDYVAWDSYCVFQGDRDFLWWTHPPDDALGGNYPCPETCWVIATVPEPSAFDNLGLLLAASAFVRRSSLARSRNLRSLRQCERSRR